MYASIQHRVQYNGLYKCAWVREAGVASRKPERAWEWHLLQAHLISVQRLLVGAIVILKECKEAK